MRVLLISMAMLVAGACSAPQQTEAPAGTDPQAALKDELVATAKRVWERELTWGNGGDISVRIPDSDRVIIKATGHSLGSLNHERLSILGPDGAVVGGNPKPSAEADVHAAVYQARPDIGALMHVHAPYATAWATSGRLVPVIVQDAVNVLGSAAMVPYHRVGSPELVEAVVSAYKNPETQVVFMQHHGVFVAGKDLSDVLARGETVENSARVAFFTQLLGGPANTPKLEAPY